MLFTVCSTLIAIFKNRKTLFTWGLLIVPFCLKELVLQSTANTIANSRLKYSQSFVFFLAWQRFISDLFPCSVFVFSASCVSTVTGNCPLNSEGVGIVPKCMDVRIVTVPPEFTLIAKVFFQWIVTKPFGEHKLCTFLWCVWEEIQEPVWCEHIKCAIAHISVCPSIQGLVQEVESSVRRCPIRGGHNDPKVLDGLKMHTQHTKNPKACVAIASSSTFSSDIHNLSLGHPGQ